MSPMDRLRQARASPAADLYGHAESSRRIGYGYAANERQSSSALCVRLNENWIGTPRPTVVFQSAPPLPMLFRGAGPYRPDSRALNDFCPTPERSMKVRK